MAQPINERLHRPIHTMAGSIFINPGTGAVDDATAEQAERNIRTFLQDLAIAGVVARRAQKDDYGEGRFSFYLTLGNAGKSIIQMPGWPLEQVRFMSDREQNAWDFPRLYVDDSSWLWCYALSNAKRALLQTPEDE